MGATMNTTVNEEATFSAQDCQKLVQKLNGLVARYSKDGYVLTDIKIEPTEYISNGVLFEEWECKITVTKEKELA